MDRAGRIVLTDLRSGALGRLTLETPEMMAAELEEVVNIRQQKEERRKQKDTERKKKRKAARK